MRSELSRREQQIMDVLYRLGEATANEIVEAMPNEPANATVRTQLRILEEKGVVKHRRDGNVSCSLPPSHGSRQLLRRYGAC